MGRRSDVSVPQRREAVLALLRREEPASKLARRFSPSSTVQCRRGWFLRGEWAWVFTTFRFNC